MERATQNPTEKFFKQFRLFIKETANGTRLKKDGKKIRKATVDSYIYTYKLLVKFQEKKNYDLRIIALTKNSRNFIAIKKYWKKFYIDFTNFLYHDLDHYDNYVGLVIKAIRTFFNYLKQEKNIEIGEFHKSFYAPKEEISIIALNPKQLNFLIYDDELNLRLSPKLIFIKDLFVFGCTVCLRVSDLISIKNQDIIKIDHSTYLRVYSLKTNTFTSIKLPDYAIKIIEKYKKNRVNLFPSIGVSYFNELLKKFGKQLEYDEQIIKYRSKRGVKHTIYKNKKLKTHYTLADLITTHTMRRTGITNMLRLGIPDYLVRKVSGHSPSSREFYRYVQLAQNFLDEKTDEFFEKLKNLS